MVGQWAAMSMQMMVRALQVYRITESATDIGIVALSLAIPTLLVSFLGGAAADRLQKKRILVAGRIVMAITTVAVAITVSTGYLTPEHPESWWILVASSIFQGIVSGFTQPALMSIIPEIVGKDKVMNAISLSTSGQHVFRLISPAFAGFLIDAYGFAAVYYIMAGCYAVSAFGTSFLPISKSRIASGLSAVGDAMKGIKYLRRETVILLIVVFALCHVVAGQPYQQLLPVFTEDILKVGASGLGILMALSAGGALIGSLVMGSLPNKRRGLLLLLSGVIMGVSVMLFASSRMWYLSLAIIPFIGLGPSIHGTMTSTLVQSYVEPDYRGRMQSFVAMAQGLASLGTFLAGILSDKLGVQWAVFGMALILTIISCAFIVFAKGLRRLD
jgi:MFS family permease